MPLKKKKEKIRPIQMQVKLNGHGLMIECHTQNRCEIEVCFVCFVIFSLSLFIIIIYYFYVSFRLNSNSNWIIFTGQMHTQVRWKSK